MAALGIKAINDTQIPQCYSSGLYTEMSYDLAAEHTSKMLDVLVWGVTNCLADVKSTEFPVVFKFEQSNGEFIAAAIVEYYPNEDDASKPGQWNYSWTFNKEDVPENGRVLSPYDGQYATYFRGVGHQKYGMTFEKTEYAGDTFKYLLKTISQYLSDNAADSAEVGVKLDGVITFRAVVEDGKVIKSAELDGEVKQKIKDDAAIEA